MNDIDVDRIKDHFDFFALVQSDTSLRKVGSKYWVAPCYLCGGGEDRFTMKDVGGGTYLWICRKCGDGKYADAIDYVMQREGMSFMNALKKMGLDDLEMTGSSESRKQQVVANEKRKAEIDARLSDLSTQEVWEALNRRLTDEHRKWWASQGIPNAWQDYLSLGYTPDKTYYDADQNIAHSPAYTIPYFHHDENGKGNRAFKTMQYRLFEPPNPADRYRFEYGLGTTFFMATPTLPIGPNVVVTEGAKKAVVTRIWGGDREMTVLGVPSKSDFGNVADCLKHCARVWVVLDPDGCDRARLLAKQIGDHARVIELPMKIDDAFLHGGLSQRNWIDFLKQGVKI